MPILINHKLCDEAPECGGIEVCPVHAFYFDKKKQKISIDQSKCIECLKCTLPDVCPVGCILYARNKIEEKKIKKMIQEDRRTKKWLWKERYGCQPGKTSPLVENLNQKNIQKVIKQKGIVCIDVWNEKFLDCRLHSPLYEEIYKEINVSFYKLDGLTYPLLADKLKIKIFPTLLLYKNQQEVLRHEGYLNTKTKLKSLKEKVKNL